MKWQAKSQWGYRWSSEIRANKHNYMFYVDVTLISYHNLLFSWTDKQSVTSKLLKFDSKQESLGRTYDVFLPSNASFSTELQVTQFSEPSLCMMSIGPRPGYVTFFGYNLKFLLRSQPRNCYITNMIHIEFIRTFWFTSTTVLKTEEDNRSRRLKERKSQGEVDLNSQGWQLPKGANPYRNPGKSRGPEVAAPSLDYSATDRYSVLRNY
jgi:hypothetical protein